MSSLGGKTIKETVLARFAGNQKLHVATVGVCLAELAVFGPIELAVVGIDGQAVGLLEPLHQSRQLRAIESHTAQVALRFEKVESFIVWIEGDPEGSAESADDVAPPGAVQPDALDLCSPLLVK